MTFPTGVIEIRKCSHEELKTILDEAREASKHSRKLGRVMGIVAAHRLKQMQEFLAYQELATWRRMNGFDRIVKGEQNWSHVYRSLPPTPEQYTASLWSEVNALENAISMPTEDTVTRPRQQDSLDEMLANFEFARTKAYVEKRSRDEATQVQVTVTQVNTVQHASPYPLDPEPSPDVCVKLENTETGKMGPELEELESPSAGTVLETPGQQCPPNEGIWEQGRTTVFGILTADVDSSQKENISSPITESVDKRAKDTTTVADFSSKAATPSKRRHKTFSEQNKQFDPGGRRQNAPPWDAAVTLLSFSREKLGGFLSVFYLCSVSALCVLVFRNHCLFRGDPFSAKLKETRVLDVDQVADVRNRRASIFSSITLLKIARTSNTRFGRSANTLG